jgi:hypothetical protein
MTAEPLYVVLSLEHDGRWWGPGGSGYVRELSKAGLYTREGALDICIRAMPGTVEGLNEIPVRLEDAEAMRDRYRALYALGPRAIT